LGDFKSLDPGLPRSSKPGTSMCPLRVRRDDESINHLRQIERNLPQTAVSESSNDRQKEAL
jgi:hypothetical protein